MLKLNFEFLPFWYFEMLRLVHTSEYFKQVHGHWQGHSRFFILQLNFAHLQRDSPTIMPIRQNVQQAMKSLQRMADKRFFRD